MKKYSEFQLYKIWPSGKFTYNQQVRKMEYNLRDSLWSIGLLFEDKIEGFTSVSKSIVPSSLLPSDCDDNWQDKVSQEVQVIKHSLSTLNVVF